MSVQYIVMTLSYVALLNERTDSATALTTALHELTLVLAMSTMEGSDTIILASVLACLLPIKHI